ncbi:MAG: glycosyltransferase family 2 protein [Patescibacteria group bacterium]|nr:glycosyltransferase family 2 protein [Patescibacteria group bacterium]
MIDLSIVIVSYNTKEFLKKCLKSIKNNCRLNYEVIVVDNGSVDGSAEVIDKEFKNVILFQNAKNLGFSKANNIGIKKANGKYVLFLNSDTEIKQQTLEEIFEFMEKNKYVGVATCKVELPNGSLDDACHRGFPTPWNSFTHFSGISKIFPYSNLFNGYHLGWKNLNTIHEIDACAGAFMFTRKKAGDEIGWWDEDYFWYGEDLDFCYRLKKKGWKIYFIPSVSTLHYKGISGGIKNHSKHLSTADSETRKFATKARFDAMKIFYNKHYKNKYPKIVTWLILQGINLKYLMNK